MSSGYPWVPQQSGRISPQPVQVMQRRSSFEAPQQQQQQPQQFMFNQPQQPVSPFSVTQKKPAVDMSRGGKCAMVTIIVVSIVLYLILLGLSASTLMGLNAMKEEMATATAAGK